MKLFDFGNAFKMPSERPVTREEEELVAELAGKIKARDMEVIAVLAIESTRPLHNLGSQAMCFLMPLMDLVATPEKQELFKSVLQKPKAVDKLLALLEHKQDGKPAKQTGEENGKNSA